ncbi:MAG TPA: SemiSWEET transporter [Candidatus Nitrosocosmicus sp.]|nr:SemiSWEET transporter [Candidatus Nitrosocosmicus sp.]
MQTIGFIAAILTTISFLPQVIKILKTKQTKDISLLMYVILATGVFLWIVYGVYRSDVAIIAANSITFLLILPILYMKRKNGA